MDSEWLWKCRFVKLNDFVFVLPDSKNKWLGKLTHNLKPLSINSLSMLPSSPSIPLHDINLIVGKVKDYTKGFDSFWFHLVDSEDQFSSVIKVHLSGKSQTQRMVNPGKARLFLIGSKYDAKSNVIMCSNDTLCVFVNVSLYKKLLKQPPVTFVGCSTSNSILPKSNFDASDNSSSPVSTCNDFIREDCTSVLPKPIQFDFSGYCKLKDIREGSVVNIAGCVSYFKPCQATKASNGHFRTFHIVDPSIFPQSVTVVAFADTEHKLPLILRVGDTIIMKKVEIKAFGCSLQIICNHISSFQIFGNFFDEPVQSHFKSNSKCNLSSENDAAVVSMLKNWAFSCSNLSSANNCCKLCEVFPGLQFDLVCKVVSVRHDSVSVHLSVCDGTKPVYNSNDIAGEKNDYILTINIKKQLLQFPFEAGQYLYLHKVYANPLFGKDNGDIKLEVCINDQKQLCFSNLPSTDFDVCCIKGRLDRLSYVQPFVTTHPYSHLKFTNISDILQCSKVPNSYRCDVTVVEIGLSCVEECVRLVCPCCHKRYEMPRSSTKDIAKSTYKCTSCSKADLVHSYVIPLKVKDETGSMTVYLANKWAAQFFKATPSNLYLDHSSKIYVLQCLETIFGRNPFTCTSLSLQSTSISEQPRLDCHINSYFVGRTPRTDHERMKAQVCYQVTNTVLSMPQQN